MIDRTDAQWYKDAVIYQLHVKAYQDADNDGIGDFQGLVQRLDYLQDLGVTTIWLLPFYPSPLRDDGYDIADYRTVNPSYGTMRDFKNFVRECHSRGLRVITELVINHTSDQHAWFQRARLAKPGSNHRNYYVWSNTDQKYLDTRIIFLDTEKSNWTWDPEAQAYFWHRFYSHQPDLNFDNPNVLREVTNVMRFWLDQGVDGLRLDAVPYLIEREGTNCENLPETHEILKKIRAELDASYSDRMLLAEANQWPEDVLPYFGDPEVGGDECHMAFHFPLMPRMYMAIAQEDRAPVTDIMRQTPPVPEKCQWAIFLRNHDELTLEMVTNKERDYLWEFYATDRRMRINLGIRRRLAPLMDNDRRKVELLNSLLFSMPGTPVIYYGDEIGMGDNVFLGDRDGVRTPMQWSPDRNGGFSKVDPARLYLPAIQDPIHGFQAVNVEAQLRSPSSQLNWMKRMIATRQQHKSFGRGTIRFLYPGNRKILAYLREYEDEAILCVANLSRTAQAVELDLKEFKNRIPVELLGRSPFPPVGDLTYLLTLPGYGFHWFVLAEQVALPRWHTPLPEPMPEFATLIFRSNSWETVSAGAAGQEMIHDVLPAFMKKQRWFGAKDQTVTNVRVISTTELPPSVPADDSFLLAEVELSLEGNPTPQRYLLPFALTWDESAGTIGSPLLAFTIARARRGPRVGGVYDALHSDAFALAITGAIRKGLVLHARGGGEIVFHPTTQIDEITVPEGTEARLIGVEQTNSSVMLGDIAVLKIYRRLTEGVHPELEVGRFLTDIAEFKNTPPLLGSVEHRTPDKGCNALALLQGYVRNQGDGWTYATEYLDRELDDLRLGEPEQQVGGLPKTNHVMFTLLASKLGERTAELHRALATPTDDPAFAAEPITTDDIASWRTEAMQQAERAFAVLDQKLKNLSFDLIVDVDRLLSRRQECLSVIDTLTDGPVDAVKTRIHGDYHLGQALVALGDWYIIDFEGEPLKSLAQRRAKNCPLRDVAGMVRSFNYVAWATVMDLQDIAPDMLTRLRDHAFEWERAATEAFLSHYHETVTGCPSIPADPLQTQRLLDLFLLEKALYEITYEAANRPAWLSIPVRGVLDVLDRIVSRTHETIMERKVETIRTE